MKAKKWLIGAGIALVAIQFVPFGHTHTNPPVTKEPAWDSPRIRTLVVRACYDCHSNETNWKWYTSVAPASWLTQRDVNDGRRALNFSEWDRPRQKSGDIAGQVRSGEMPPWFYTPLHPEAKLTEAEKAELVAWAEKSFPRPAGRDGFPPRGR